MNNILLQYLMWRVANNLHKSITYSFLPVGHTKFSPDWCFGLLKRKLRHSKVDSLHDLVGVVERSATVNLAQLTGTQNGEVIVKTYNWQEHLSSSFKKVPQIKKVHHFKITKNDEGQPVLKVKEDIYDNFHEVNMVTGKISSELPTQIIPKGLSLERQSYLYNKIRPFCAEEYQDDVCPLPPGTTKPLTTPPTTPVPVTTIPPTASLHDSSVNKKQEKKRVCGNCGESGHNRRTCPK